MTTVRGGGALTALRAAAVGSLWLCAAALPVRAQIPPLSAACQAALDARLGQAGIAPGEIREQAIGRRTSVGEAAHLIGYSVWLKLARCEGRVVVDLTTECWVQQAYTRGGCRVDGMKQW